jgi:hypothetical protein
VTIELPAGAARDRSGRHAVTVREASDACSPAHSHGRAGKRSCCFANRRSLRGLVSPNLERRGATDAADESERGMRCGNFSHSDCSHRRSRPGIRARPHSSKSDLVWTSIQHRRGAFRIRATRSQQARTARPCTSREQARRTSPKMRTTSHSHQVPARGPGGLSSWPARVRWWASWRRQHSSANGSGAQPRRAREGMVNTNEGSYQSGAQI